MTLGIDAAAEGSASSREVPAQLARGAAASVDADGERTAAGGTDADVEVGAGERLDARKTAGGRREGQTQVLEENGWMRGRDQRQEGGLQ